MASHPRVRSGLEARKVTLPSSVPQILEEKRGTESIVGLNQVQHLSKTKRDKKHASAASKQAGAAGPPLPPCKDPLRDRPGASSTERTSRARSLRAAGLPGRAPAIFANRSASRRLPFGKPSPVPKSQKSPPNPGPPLDHLLKRRANCLLQESLHAHSSLASLAEEVIFFHYGLIKSLEKKRKNLLLTSTWFPDNQHYLRPSKDQHTSLPERELRTKKNLVIEPEKSFGKAGASFQSRPPSGHYTHFFLVKGEAVEVKKDELPQHPMGPPQKAIERKVPAPKPLAAVLSRKKKPKDRPRRPDSRFFGKSWKKVDGRMRVVLELLNYAFSRRPKSVRLRDDA